METWYRRFLRWISSLIFLGTTAELLLLSHVESTIQLIPFGLCALGLGMAIWVHYLQSETAVLWTRRSMVLICIGSIYGIYEHFSHNLELELEIRPNADWTSVIGEALTGASPMLVSAILCVAAILLFASLKKSV